LQNRPGKKESQKKGGTEGCGEKLFSLNGRGCIQVLDNSCTIVEPLKDSDKYFQFKKLFTDFGQIAHTLLRIEPLRCHELSKPEAMFLNYVANKEKEDENGNDTEDEDHILPDDALSGHAEQCLKEEMESEVSSSIRAICTFCDWYVDNFTTPKSPPPPKHHILAFHTRKWLAKRKSTGLFGEQANECLHHLYNKTRTKLCSIRSQEKLMISTAKEQQMRCNGNQMLHVHESKRLFLFVSK